MRLTIIMAVLCATAVAQSEFVRIFGAVGDGFGARLADACVTLRFFPAGPALSTRANHEGEFDLKARPDTSYDLSFRAPGFKPATRRIDSGPNGLAVGFVALPVKDAPIGPDILSTAVERGLPGPDRIRSGGNLFPRDACTLDFDSGQSSCPDGNSRPSSRGADARIDRAAEHLYFSPLNGAKLAWGTGRRPGQACNSAHYANKRLKIDAISEGTPVCLRTDEGRRTELWLFFKKDPCVEGEIRIEFVTWDR
jgi:hypothetical protein